MENCHNVALSDNENFNNMNLLRSPLHPTLWIMFAFLFNLNLNAQEKKLFYSFSVVYGTNYEQIVTKVYPVKGETLHYEGKQMWNILDRDIQFEDKLRSKGLKDDFGGDKAHYNFESYSKALKERRKYIGERRSDYPEGRIVEIDFTYFPD